ncbi:translation initiation factor IF-2 [Bacteroidota bacterium]
MDIKAKRLSKIAREFNVGISTIVEFLQKKDIEIDSNPNTKIPPEYYELLVTEYSAEKSVKKESEKLSLKMGREQSTTVSIDDYQREKEINIEQQFEEELLIVDSNINTEQKEESLEIEKKLPEKTIETTVEEEDITEKADEIEEKEEKKETEDVTETETKPEPEVIAEKEEKTETITEDSIKKPKKGLTVIGEIDLDKINQKTKPAKKTKKEKEAEKEEKKKVKKSEKRSEEIIQKEEEAKIEKPLAEEKLADTSEEIKTEFEKLSGPTVVGKIELPKEHVKKKPVASSKDNDWKTKKKKKRKRIKQDKIEVSDQKTEEGGKNKEAADQRQKGKSKGRKSIIRHVVSEEEVQKQIKDTLARLTTKTKSKGAKYRRLKRDAVSQKHEEDLIQQELEKKIIKVTEFVSVNELSVMMDIQVNDIISTCLNLGMFVSINQRLDAKTMSIVAEEFGFEVEFTSIEIHEAIKEKEDIEEDLEPRPPIVTVMGHVDHGKTSLLDHIRKANVIAGEAGGITQHIGAYNVTLENGNKITFLDTPGHEAFTAMRARGAQATDIAIIVVAADDNVMPQTVEAINHATAAGVPIVFAINKIDKPGANPEKIKEELANMNFMVEDWGGKYQSQEISAKNGVNIDELLEKVLLESELLDLKANPNKNASGIVIESTLDKGRGYVTTLLVNSGTLKIQDILLAGSQTGRVKALFNERGKKINEVKPSEPVSMLGLSGAVQAGDKFNVMSSEREAREIGTKREQLLREQGLRTQKHITLEEIGRRIAIGNFQELNIIIKGDVDGSIEALTDSLVKLSTEEIQINVRHKAVGPISESDILLATASDAVIIGFQVRPSIQARKLAEKEGIDIRLYSVIYDAINELKSAMKGMLRPEFKEQITANAEVLETFKITKTGTIAGCQVKEGKMIRKANVRVIRDGIVIYTGVLGSLKRFKEDVKEVATGYECGLNIENFNDIKVGDMIEAFLDVEIERN